MNALLGFHGVSLRRGGRLLFEDLDLALGHGDALHVRGPNGSGKSSLIRLAAGLLQPTAGAVCADAGVGLIDDKFPFDLERTVADELSFWIGLRGGPTLPIRDALMAFGIGHLARVPMRLLSTGQRKRTAFARLLADNSVIWLLDEPLNGLDEDGANLVQREIAAHQAGGKVVVYASHQPLNVHDAKVLELGR